jgi:membrane protein implicated in regulation of membrane protease activity
VTGWKHRFAIAGFAAAVLGVLTERALVIWVAIALLAAALALRLVERYRARRTASGRDNLSGSRDA